MEVFEAYFIINNKWTYVCPNFDGSLITGNYSPE